jgi:hypothetical protein
MKRSGDISGRPFGAKKKKKKKKMGCARLGTGGGFDKFTAG